MAVRRPSGTLDENYSQSMAIVRTRLQWILAIIGLLLLFVLPLGMPADIVSLFCIFGITIIAVLGLSILTGYTGQISLGHAAFMAVGAYTCGVLMAKAGFSFWLAMPIGAISAAVVGGIFGLPSLRMKGFYLAMSTLAAQVIIVWLLGHVWVETLGGYDGIAVPAPRIGDIIFNTPQSMYYLIFVFVIIMTYFAINITRTRAGRAFIAIRDNDIAAEVMGVNVFGYKVLAFFISAIYAGLAGSLYAVYLRAINPEYFTLMSSIWYLGMIIVGGMGSTLGAILGAVLIKTLDFSVMKIVPIIAGISPTLANQLWAGSGSIIFGLVVILFLIIEPRGLAHMWQNMKAWYRLWPFSH